MAHAGLAGPIGLLGGSFDPVHAGHLQLARDAMARLDLAEVRFIPAAQPWQKAALTGAKHRLEMMRLAIAGAPRFALDTSEIERGGASYTVDTLRELRARLGPDVPLVLVMGGDQFANLDTWREWQRLVDLAHLAVALRGGQPLQLNAALAAFADALDCAPHAIRARPAGCVVRFAMTASDASATEIRALLAQPRSTARDARLAALLPAPVLDYIRRNALYAPTNGPS